MKKEVTALSLALALSLGLTAPAYAAGATFTDVPAEHWAYSAWKRWRAVGWCPAWVATATPRTTR